MMSFAPATVQDIGILSEVLKAAPSAVSTVLVIVVVWAFLKHERARDKDFAAMLTAANAVNKEQREQAIVALSETTKRLTDAMTSLGHNMERLSEGQTRILEAIHGCFQRERA